METYGIVVCENDQVQLKNLHGFVNRAVWSLEDSPDSKDKTCEVVLVTTSYQEVVNYLNNTYIDSGVYFLDIDLGKDDGQNGIQAVYPVCHQLCHQPCGFHQYDPERLWRCRCICTD